MHLTSLFAALTALAIGVQAGLPSRDALDAREATKTNRYIVEFDNTANLQAAGLKRVDNAIHERMYTDLRARGISFSVFQEYTADIFVGASITVDSEADLANLAGATGVINIIPVHLIPIPDVPTGVDRDFVRASLESIPGGGQVAANATQAIFAAPGTVRRTGFSALPQISADKVQATGNLGKGIKIGIIDTGVDYTRTPLGGCFGPGCKVVGGFDFVGDNYNGQNVPVPGGLPLDKCSGHGTVTAGIIGANDNEYGVPGVAPEASLYAYRTYGCVGTSGEDVLFLAMQRAYQDGVDVLNLSLGEVASWTSSALSVMASRLVARGIIVVAAAGNNQVAGPFLGSAPATGLGVLGVGSVNNSVLPAHNLTTSTGYGPIRMYNYRNFPEGTYPIATYPDDPYGCEPAPIDLSGKIVIIRKGRCDALTKARNAFSLYGQYILFVPDGDEEPFYYDYRTLNGADVSKADGDWLFANTGATLTAGFRPAPRPNTYSGGRGTYFSNQGPTNDLFLNTDILAPGNNIVGVLPDNADLLLTNWSITDGTSWSSAFASGSAALYLKSKDASPAEIDRAFLNTADPIATTNTDSTLLSISQQGAGVLNLADAIKTSTVIEPSVLLLNDTAYFEGRQVITITNNGRSDRNYQLKNVAAGTQLALDPASNYTNDFPTPQVNNGAQLQASRSDSSFRLRPGRSRRIQLTFTAPQGLDPKTLPVYSGYVQVTSEEGVQNVPYIGVARRMRDNAVFDGTDRFFGPGFKLPLTADYATLSVSPAGKVYTFQGSDYPAVFYRFLGGSRAVYIDLVRADANLGFTPTYTKRDETAEWEADFGVEARDFAPVHVNRRWFWDNWFGNGNNGNNGNGLTNFDKLLCKLTGDFFPLCRDKQGSFAKVPTVGNLVTQTLVTRDRSDAGIFQLFEFSQPNFRNQTRVPNGNYRFLLRGLKVTGDPTKNEEYESYVSPPFTIQAPLV